MSDDQPDVHVTTKWLPANQTFTIHGDKALLFKALATAQGSFKPVLKTRENPFYKSMYADLADVLEACVPALNANGLALIQPPSRCEGKDWAITTLLTHESGAYFEVTATIPPVADWQKFGSAVTYCRRYVVGGLLGVAPEADDDGNEATKGNAQPQPAREQLRRSPPPLPQSPPPKASAPDSATARPISAASSAIEMMPKDSPLRVADGPETVDMPADSELPALAETKLDIRVAMLALGSKGPDVTRKVVAVFGPGVKVTDVTTESMCQLLLGSLLRDIEATPGLMATLPSIRAAELAKATK